MLMYLVVKVIKINISKKTKIKTSIFFILCLLIPIAAYLDYLYSGYKSPTGYFITCLFEILIFFSGVCLGEYIEKVYGHKEKGRK